MFKDFFQLYQIGGELGLTTKEISGLFFFKEKDYGKIIFYVILIIILSFVVLILVLLSIDLSRDTYPSGSYYSTIRIKDFKKKLNMNTLKK